MYTRVNGTELFLDVDGSGPVRGGSGPAGRPVVLALHSPGHDHTYLRAGLSALTDTAQVIYVDLPGSGRSGGALPAVTLESMADDVAALCRTLGVRPAVLGHAAGGYVAQLVALRHPDVVRALLLVGTGPTGDLSEGMTILGMRHGPATRAAAERVFGGDFSPAALRVFTELVLPTYFHDPTRAGPSMRAWASCWRSPGMVRRLIEDLAPRFDVWARLPEITAPTFVVTGADDWVNPPGVARVLARGLADARVAVVVGAGHVPFAEQPDWFCAVASAMLTALDPATEWS